jgi:phosphatidylglycerol---prolipoprotein diacylglyceryl transferase
MDINPVITSFKLFNLPITLTWYGLIVMSSVVIGAWLAEREVRRRGENGEALFDAMVWAVLFGILGARIWYVVNATLGGNTSFREDPLSIITPPIAGLHFFGGLLFGGFALLIFLKRNGYDQWLFLDAVAPVTLVGQAVGRLGNFINQELYGPPTDLPWGISISAIHRLPQFADLSQFPVETTRFHPTFAYEMILNVLAFLFIIWYTRTNEEETQPGTAFSLWLICAGFIRVFIEFFRPDQPRIGDSFITYSMLIAFLMGVAGVVFFMARNGSLYFAFAENLPDSYKIKPVEAKPTRKKINPTPEATEAVEEEEIKPVKKRVIRKTAVKKSVTKKKTTK